MFTSAIARQPAGEIRSCRRLAESPRKGATDEED